MDDPRERELTEELFALIRELHRKKHAEEIIVSFEGVFAGHESADERVGILEYWRDFYRLRQYRRLKRRRRPTLKERMTACSACSYPMSHRHHLWDIAMHGENKVTVQLCANCHELHHLIYNALVRDSEYSRKLVWHVMFSGQVQVPLETVEKIVAWVKATILYEADNGWAERFRATDEWIEERLHWSDFVKKATNAV